MGGERIVDPEKKSEVVMLSFDIFCSILTSAAPRSFQVRL